MHRGTKTVMLLAALVALVLATTGLSSADEDHRPPGCSTLFTVQDFRAFSADVWDPAGWRSEPKKNTIAAAEHKRLCAAGRGRARSRMKDVWTADKKQFYERRARELFRVRITPFYGGGKWWAIPYSMVICESSGINFTYGYYSMLDPAWHEWSGGLGGHAGEYSKRLQDKAAAVGWDMYGEGAWECKSDGEPHPF